ncbi:MAG TPA: protein kinase [Candidatus Sulfotelmatobacter sp.]|nr:protein kinase [Candidatus Sulfotelmatobacter sp.]
MDSSLAKPSRIGAYDIVDVIGRGGMGTVFQGNDPRIGRPVAIKMLTAAAEDPDLLIRFYREAKYTGRLHHQNIVTVYELGHQDGVPYLVMEFLEGVSLETMISTGRVMPVAEKLAIILQVCSGLTYAHKNGLVHRDIKPANIMILGDGTAKIVDFGIALLGGSRLTRTGHVVGSLNYMSPEQLSGNVEVDARTDVYSTGVVLFQLLTGVLPFDGGSTAATLRKIVQDPPPPLSKYLTDRPEELDAILQKALVKNREDRYASPEDFAVDLARVHPIYLKKMVGETLQQAAEAFHRKDFTTARQQVLQVLKGAPQNSEAAELLRQIKQGQDQQQLVQQVLHLQMKAEEAFRKNHLEEALQYVEHGMRLDPEGAVFPSLRDAIREAQARVQRHREALKHAETALRAGDLDTAKLLVEEAQRNVPDDPAARTLATQIIARLEQKLSEQKLAEKQRQFALAVNSAEKGMADARMLLMLGQVAEAQQSLENMASEVAQLPPRWTEQFEALKKEVLEKKSEIEKPTQESLNAFGMHTAEMPAPSSATVVLQPGVDAQRNVRDVPREPIDLQAEPRPSEDTRPVPTAETGSFAPSETAHDVLYPRRESTGGSEEREIAPELREFLEPVGSAWSRPIMWIGLAALIVVGLVVWLMMRPGSESQSRTKTADAGAAVVASYTYAEINAEPWATVTDVAPSSGEAPSIVGQATPLRVKLPPGQYTVTLQGPNHEQKRVDVTVPQQGGASCFAVFKKPDLNRIVGKE